VERQTKTLDEAFEMLSELTERIKKVETENQQLREEIRKWRNAYARAIRWIHEKGLGSEIPDFLLDSEPRITGVK
jgi:predicted nuclease with TOPRIM domain